MITDKYDFPDKTLVTNVPFLKGEIDIRDYTQEAVNECFEKLIVITDAVSMYENIPVTDLEIMDFYDLLDKINHRNFKELVDDIDTFILVRIYDQLPPRVIEVLNKIIKRTHGTVLIVSSMDNVDIIHSAKFDMEEDDYIDESLTNKYASSESRFGETVMDNDFDISDVDFSEFE